MSTQPFQKLGLKLFGMLALVVFCAELTVALLLEEHMMPLPAWGAALIEALLLSAAISSISYFIAFRPIAREFLSSWASLQASQEQSVEEAERALRRSEAKYKQLVDCAEAVILRWDMSGRVTFLNEYGEHLFGHQAAEVVGKDILETIVPPSESQTGRDLRDLINDILHSPEKYSRNENENVCKDGRRLWISWTNTVLRDEGGNAVEILSVGTDVTPRREIEHALAQAEVRSRSILESAGEGILGVDAYGTATFVNPAAARMLGYRVEELVGKVLHPLVHHHKPDGTPYPSEECPTALAFKEGLITDVKSEVYWRKDGSSFSVDYTSTPMLMDGFLCGAVVTFRDVTVQKKTEESLRKLSSAVEGSPLSIIITDVHGDIEYVNPKFEEVTGYARREVLGRNPRFLKSGNQDAVFYQEMWNTLTSGKEWHGEFHNIRRDQSLFWERASISPIRNERGDVTHYVGLKEDITEQRRVAEQLRQAKEDAEAANRAKSTFLANMSHEIRTPLNAIMGFCQILRQTSLSEHQCGYLDIISRSSEHLLTLINDILDMSRIEAGRATLNSASFDVNRLLQDLASMFTLPAREKRLEFEVGAVEDIHRFLRTDESKLRQVLINLVGNAIKFTVHGRVTVQPAVILADGQPSELTIQVEDTGPGIASHEMNDLFDAFVQTSSGRAKHGGTGLGLAISRKFARLMGGDISVQSIENQGSVFTLRVQVQQGNRETASAEPAPGRVLRLAASEPRFRILIADDVGENRRLIVEHLVPLGFEVFEAENGQECLRLFQDCDPHLVLMDMGMPVMDGYEATRRIKETEKGKQTPVIAVTAQVLSENREQILAAGVDGFLAKPFRDYEVSEMIGKHLNAQYLYGSSSVQTASASSASADQALDDSLARIPSHLRDALREAVLSGRSKRLAELIAQVAGIDAALGETLQSLADGFQYRYLLEHLDDRRLT